MVFSLAITTAEDVAASERSALIAELAAIRWGFEVGGLTMENGAMIRTDRETRAALTEAVNALTSGLMQAPVAWKMSDGWQDLSQADLEAITMAVSQHVQASFAAERVIQAQIEALEDLAGFDVQAAFDQAAGLI